jgi:regulator of sigma E protease
MWFLTTVLPGIVLIGGLVFFHELGHFLAAKHFGVKVLKFSLGFGPRVWGFTRGETEYQLAALPLGGFVRMAGEDPSTPLEAADRGRGFAEQAPYKRAVIALAGPAINLLLPPLVYFALFLTPMAKVPADVGTVLPGEPAAEAGLKPGDRVVAVEGVPTPSFEELRRQISARPGQATRLTVDRLGQPVALTITPASETTKSPLGPQVSGKIGIMPGRLAPVVGLQDGSRGHEAGLRTFDRVTKVNGRAVSSALELEGAVAAAGSAAVTLEVVRAQPLDLPTSPVGGAEVLTITVPAGDTPLELQKPDLFVRDVKAESPAFEAGLRTGDRVVSVNGTQVGSLLAFGRLVEGRTALQLEVERAGQRRDLAFSLRQLERDDPYLGKVSEPELGFGFDTRTYQPEEYRPEELVRVSYGVGEAASRAVEQTIELTSKMVLVIRKLFVGDIPTRSIGGPIEMFRLAKVSAGLGIDKFLELFALISINLGLMNLLPVPILDGFHIVVSGIETISRRPVSPKFREAANYVGLAMLLALMVLAMKNDILRSLG